MKRSLVLSFATLFALPSFGAPVTYVADPAASKVEWVGKKVTGQHNGTLALKTGNFTFDGETLKAGRFAVDMTSLKVLDLTDPKYNGDLTNHLKSDDFFSVAGHAEATFEAKTVTKNADGTWNLKGPMTIKGIANEVSIPLKVTKTADAVEAVGKVTLDRTKWQIKFRSGKFFPNLGDKLIHDGFDVAVDIKAKKS